MRCSLVVVMAGVVLVGAACADRLPSVTLQAYREAALAGGGLDPSELQYPSRPSVFKTPGELRQYLDALNAYFAIAGRPRFGKRGDALGHRGDVYDY